ncbi:PucR family transcriptional regulator [Anaeromicropila herbilytica]|uniref:Transcriptional regulator n=1 Tax=Anaeromicropila herbilytica TaxID=2785025 RepID=A0A7R7EJX0_9FIRM|nr:PucR family transcriptional regulator ligand-binding domain-containing protein [Anaeromicropila herbilytica]BCN30050.1 transcriptional regulator [Anaeromicropila herbilytica]
MKTQVNALYEFAKGKYQLDFHSGRNGMNNTVSWIYLAEDIQNISFLKGGELVITTGLFRSNGISLLEFIRALSMNNCSCILINIGKYLFEEDLTPEIIDFCEINKIPLFTFPWDVHLVEIMQDYCRILLQDNQREDHLSAAFQSALYQTSVPDNILRTLNQYGFQTNSDYRIIVIRNLHDTTIITSPLNSYGLKYHLFFYDNFQILIYHSNEAELSLDKLIELLCYCDSIALGISDEIHSITQIGQSYKRAFFSLAAAQLWKRSFVIFDELGIFQLLYCCSDPAILYSIYQRDLGILEQHDVEHDTDYLNTLRYFLLSDCNLIETASRLFTHRNTIVYRIRKIKDLLGTELDNSSIKFNLLMSFYIKEYLSM